MDWPPEIGAAMPRATDAWCHEEKWARWILAERGHGPEWLHVFGVGPEDWRQVWRAIRVAVKAVPVTEVRLSPDGVGCGVVVDLRIGPRRATVLSAWHYSHRGAAPRLVTAYPTPYTRAHGHT